MIFLDQSVALYVLLRYFPPKLEIYFKSEQEVEIYFRVWAKNCCNTWSGLLIRGYHWSESPTPSCQELWPFKEFSIHINH